MILITSCASLTLHISHPTHIKHISLYKDNTQLPNFLIHYDVNDVTDDALIGELRVSTGRAIFDKIIVEKNEYEYDDVDDLSVILMFNEKDKLIWTGKQFNNVFVIIPVA